MDTTIHQKQRPLAVTLGLALFVANQSLILVYAAIRGNWHSPNFYINFGLSLAVLFVQVWFIFRGKNWARWLLVAMMFAGFCVLPWFIKRYSSHSASWITLSVLQNLADIVVLVALFLPSSNRWFRRCKTLPPNTALKPTATAPSDSTEK